MTWWSSSSSLSQATPCLWGGRPTCGCLRREACDAFQCFLIKNEITTSHIICHTVTLLPCERGQKHCKRTRESAKKYGQRDAHHENEERGCKRDDKNVWHQAVAVDGGAQAVGHFVNVSTAYHRKLDDRRQVLLNKTCASLAKPSVYTSSIFNMLRFERGPMLALLAEKDL